MSSQNISLFHSISFSRQCKFTLQSKKKTIFIYVKQTYYFLQATKNLLHTASCKEFCLKSISRNVSLETYSRKPNCCTISPKMQLYRKSAKIPSAICHVMTSPCVIHLCQSILTA